MYDQLVTQLEAEKGLVYAHVVEQSLLVEEQIAAAVEAGDLKAAGWLISFTEDEHAILNSGGLAVTNPSAMQDKREAEYTEELAKARVIAEAEIPYRDMQAEAGQALDDAIESVSSEVTGFHGWLSLVVRLPAIIPDIAVKAVAASTRGYSAQMRAASAGARAEVDFEKRLAAARRSRQFQPL